MSFVAEHKGAFVWSVLLHGTVATALLITFKLPARPIQPVPATPIQGVIVDQSVLENQTRQREQAAQRERERVRREERERREAVEQQRVAERQEQQRRDEAQRERAAAEKREQEQAAAAKREQERKVQEQRDQQAREQRERAEAAKREAAAAEQRRRQQQAERELADALAAERATADAVAAGLLDQYMLMIQSRVKQFWVRPLSARPGIDCVINVTQLPTGDVIDARIGSCNGDDAVRRSIEKAVRDASPLPRAPSQAVFSRTFSIRFQPDQ